MEEQCATGRRKTAVASVRIRDGKGAVNVNGKAFETYFPSDLQRKVIMSPLEIAGVQTSLDIVIRVRGGGVEAQAVAVRLGLARALVKDQESRKHVLKEAGFLTRDSRKKERKKYGQPGARKRFQFSKR